MSHGGFRHIPIVDDEKRPIGVLSVKDIVDLIVTKMTDDLLGFEEFQEA
jgi:CBS domain-containing protein